MADADLDALARAEWTPEMLTRLHAAAHNAWAAACADTPSDCCACVPLDYRVSGRTERLCHACRHVRATLQARRQRINRQ